MKTTPVRKGTLVALLLVILCAGTGCDRAEILELGAMFLPEIIAYKTLGSTGDKGIDALFEAKSVLDKINAADAKMEQGRKAGDTAPMEEAIAMRPRDPTDRVDAASLYVAQGKTTQAERHLAAARNAVKDDEDAAKDHTLEVITSFEDMKAKGDSNGYASAEQCNYVHNQLIDYYDWRWEQLGNEGKSPAARDLENEASRCQ
jgi:hypothetical protein